MSGTATRVRVNSSFLHTFKFVLFVPCLFHVRPSAFFSWDADTGTFDTIAGHDKFRWKRERKIPVKGRAARGGAQRKCSQTRKHSAKLPNHCAQQDRQGRVDARMHRVGELRENSQELSQIICFCQAPDCVRCGCAVDRRNTSCA